MQLKKYAFKNLPFSDLFTAYTDNFGEVAEFYEVNPFNPGDLKQKAASFTFKGDREQTAAILKEFNKQFEIESTDRIFENIDRLKQDDALAIVTGQQLGIYGGPVFTMFKTLTTIYQARQLEDALNRPVIPVFWLADEDHDYDEIRSIQVLNDDGPESFSLPSMNNGLPPVSELKIPEEIDQLASSVRSTLIDSDYSEELWTLLDECFVADRTFLKGFGDFIAQLFAKHGLVMAGSHHAMVKQETKTVLKEAVQKADAIRTALDKQSQKIEKRFHQQVKLYDSHLFYLDNEIGRSKITRDGDRWMTDNGHQWNTDGLLDEIDDKPEKFSPDVFLRPVLQDRLLPTLGYVAGPGEVAYYGQMKSFYRCFNQHMPAIFPRLSATFIEPAIDRILKELPFSIHEYNSRIEDLESSYVDRIEEIDIDALFENWKHEVEEASESFITQIIAIDDTLEGAAGKAQATYENAREKLKGKVYRAVKKREKIQLNRVQRIQQNLFPGRNLQERTLCGIYYMNKFGLDIWDRLLTKMDNTDLDSHTLIYL